MHVPNPPEARTAAGAASHSPRCLISSSPLVKARFRGHSFRGARLQFQPATSLALSRRRRRPAAAQPIEWSTAEMRVPESSGPRARRPARSGAPSWDTTLDPSEDRELRPLPGVILRLLHHPVMELPTPPPPALAAAVRSVEPWRLAKVVVALSRARGASPRLHALHRWLRAVPYEFDLRLSSQFVAALSREHRPGTRSGDAGAWDPSPGANDDGEGGNACPDPTAYARVREVIAWTHAQCGTDAHFATQAIKAALWWGDLEAAEDASRRAKDAGVESDSHLWGARVQLAAARGQADAVAEAAREACQGSVRLSNPLVAVLAKATTDAGLPGDVREGIFEAALRQGLRLNPRSAAPLLENTSPATADRIFQALLTGGHLPDVVACTAVMQVLVGAGDLPRASQFLHWMRDHGLRPNAVTLSVLAQGMAQFGARDGLMRFLENMEDEYGVRPNHRTFAMVIRACRTPSHASLAFDLYERLLRARRLGRHGDGAVVLGTMLKQQLDGGVGAEAMGATAARAVAAGIALNAVHHNVILAAVSRQESYARAAAYADALGPGLRDRVTHETLINAAGAEGRVAEAEGHVGEIVAMGKVPSDRALSGLVRAYVQAGQARAGVMRCRRRFRRWGAGVAGWNALLSACEEASLFDVAVDVYQEMRSGELGVKPDSTTHAVMSSVTAKGVEQVTEQQALLSALTAAGAAAGAMLIRAGLL